MSSTSIANQLAAKLAMSQAPGESNAEGQTERESAAGNTNSRAELKKPSMMSVAESQGEDQDKVVCSKTFGEHSNFKATQSGISLASLQFGKSIHNSNFKQVARSTIASVTQHVEAMPMPKKFQIAKKKAALEEKKKKLAEEKAEREAAEAAGIKLPKKPKVNKFAYPEPEPLPPPEPLTVAQAMEGATSWNAANVIANKFSVGTLTTAHYKERTDVF